MQPLHTIVVQAGINTQSIDVFLSSRLRKLSRKKVQNLIFKQAVIVNGKPVSSDYEIGSGDVIEVLHPFSENQESELHEDLPLNIIFEDDALIIVDKPAGMPVHKGLGNHRGLLLNALTHYFKSTGQEINRNDCQVHRLDKGTSGLIVFAKNKIVKSQLELQIKNKQMQRTYNALVWGNITDNEGIIDIPVGRTTGDEYQIRAFPLKDGGKEAVTFFKVLQRFEFATLVACTLQSGRTHQIRIHLQHIGHAILGDTRYPPEKFPSNRNAFNSYQIPDHQLLHAIGLAFQHPFTYEALKFEAPLPEDFQVVLDHLHAKDHNIFISKKKRE